MKFHLNPIFIIKSIIMSIISKLQQVGSIFSRENGATPSKQEADLQTVDSILGLNGETPSKYSDNTPN
tara:strand:+ start:3893 stop:4096 length:204 start_codon:yes stop_codon:yes gene_type:complete